MVIKTIDLRCTEPDEVHIWYPFFLFVDNKIPNTGHNMNIDKHEYDQLDNLERSFSLLTCIRIHDDTIQSLDTLDFEKTQDC